MTTDPISETLKRMFGGPFYGAEQTAPCQCDIDECCKNCCGTGRRRMGVGLDQPCDGACQMRIVGRIPGTNRYPDDPHD